MSETTELTKPLTEIEKAELAKACKDAGLTHAGMMLLRRALFERDMETWHGVFTSGIMRAAFPSGAAAEEWGSYYFADNTPWDVKPIVINPNPGSK